MWGGLGEVGGGRGGVGGGWIGYVGRWGGVKYDCGLVGSRWERAVGGRK